MDVWECGRTVTQTPIRPYTYTISTSTLRQLRGALARSSFQHHPWRERE